MRDIIIRNPPALFITVAIVCALFAGRVVAEGKPITVSIQVSTQGLDLSKPDDANIAYRRLQLAAREVCRHGNRIGLEALSNPDRCADAALSAAIRSAKAPLLTRAYLATHTVREATAHGIDVPAQVAALPSSAMAWTDSP
jgi:UrcA family protein